MNKFGVTVHKFGKDECLAGKYVLIKKDSISKAKPKLFLRKILEDFGPYEKMLSVVPHVPKGIRGIWHRSAFEGWISEEDAEKIMAWESLEYGLM